MKIAHLSDIHFGRITNLHILDALHADIEAAGVDLLAVSGDLTQRAMPGQFKAAVGYLQRFHVPQIVVPGNHDVYPWWRPLLRLFRPVARFQRYFGDELVRSYESPSLALFAFNSAYGWTIKGGKIDAKMIEAMEAYFRRQPKGVFKILMLHHHLTPIEVLQPHDISRSGPHAYQIASDVGVDLILCGHLHVSHVETPQDNDSRRPVIASAGTATSNRGRRSNRLLNFFNLIEINPDYFTVTERKYQPATRSFEEVRQTKINRIRS